MVAEAFPEKKPSGQTAFSGQSQRRLAIVLMATLLTANYAEAVIDRRERRRDWADHLAELAHQLQVLNPSREPVIIRSMAKRFEATTGDEKKLKTLEFSNKRRQRLGYRER